MNGSIDSGSCARMEQDEFFAIVPYSKVEYFGRIKTSRVHSQHVHNTPCIRLSSDNWPGVTTANRRPILDCMGCKMNGGTGVALPLILVTEHCTVFGYKLNIVLLSALHAGPKVTSSVHRRLQCTSAEETALQ